MGQEDGLIYAYRLDGKGGGTRLDWDTLPADADARDTWIHLDLKTERTKRWLAHESGLSPVVAAALLDEETRPRATVIDDGVLINLRGVNLNPGSDPEDMVSVRVYIDKDRIVTTRRRRLMAVQAIRDRLDAGTGPRDSAGFLIELSGQLLDRMGPVIADLDDEVDAIEDRVLTETRAALRGDLWHVRRQAILLRRYVAPQREAMTRLTTEPISWIDLPAAQRLREIADRVTRYVEDLDAARERAAIVQDELASRLGEQMNRNMYILSVIAGIFLPLSLITGLLGINVAGMPGNSWPWAFTVVSIGLVIVGAIEYFLFKRLKWI
ncbi:MAG: zinc transporter ZntB [Alphaproteobacteria bacterium]|nr:zinc transporter ZntB [Alphaproteobacteria bacterium]